MSGTGPNEKSHFKSCLGGCTSQIPKYQIYCSGADSNGKYCAQPVRSQSCIEKDGNYYYGFCHIHWNELCLSKGWNKNLTLCGNKIMEKRMNQKKQNDKYVKIHPHNPFLLIFQNKDEKIKMDSKTVGIDDEIIDLDYQWNKEKTAYKRKRWDDIESLSSSDSNDDYVPFNNGQISNVGFHAKRVKTNTR